MVNEADRQRTCDRPDAEHHRQKAVCSSGPVEGVLGEHWEDDREVEGQKPDHRHHEKWQPQLLASRRIPQTLFDASPSRRCRSPRLGGSDHEQGGDHRQVGQCVQPETHRRAHGHDKNAGQSRSDHPGAVDDHPIEAHGAGQILRRHQLTHECLPGGRVGYLDDAPGHADRHECRHLRLAGGGERPEQRRQDAVEGLGGDEELPQVHPVGHCASPGTEQQGGDPPGREDQSQVGGRVGELEHEPADGGLLQEAAARRHHLAAEIETEGPSVERTE